MEHIKGKLEVNECATNAIDIASAKRGLYIVIASIINENDELTETDRANAQELVRRWNAFEEGGIVDELLTACKAQEESDNWYGASDTGRKLKNVAKELRQAAITKARE